MLKQVHYLKKDLRGKVGLREIYHQSFIKPLSLLDKKMRFILFLIILLLLSNCVKDIWNESGGRDPITGEWEKWCPPIKRNLDGSCREEL